MLQNIKIVLPLHCVFHGIRFKVGRLEVERLPSFFFLLKIHNQFRLFSFHQKSIYHYVSIHFLF